MPTKRTASISDPWRYASLALRNIAPPVHMIHRQRRDQRRQGDDRRGLAVLRVDLLQRIGALGEVAQEDAGALGEVAGPAVDVRRKVAGQAADQLRGGPARRVRREIL